MSLGERENIKYDFAGTNVVVTGGGQGIGLQIAEDFLDAGAHVCIWDISADLLNEVHSRLGRFGSSLQTQLVDVGDWDGCERAANELSFVPHILVNNAGITRDRSFAKMSHDDFDSVMGVNLGGVFNVSKVIHARFAGRGIFKRIINMSSIVALYGNFGQTNYAASKAGVLGLTKTLARELGPKGTTVNAIAPGFIRTPMLAKVPKDQLEFVGSKIPVQRVGESRDIANACLFLASSEASYINGITLSVDGGLIA